MITLLDIFDIAADAYQEGREHEQILLEVGDAACWYDVIGPQSGRPKPPLLLAQWSVTSHGFRHLQFPIIRRIFPAMIANELVSVQPMSLPSGLLFHMDYRYDFEKQEVSFIKKKDE